MDSRNEHEKWSEEGGAAEAGSKLEKEEEEAWRRNAEDQIQHWIQQAVELNLQKLQKPSQGNEDGFKANC